MYHYSKWSLAISTVILCACQGSEDFAPPQQTVAQAITTITPQPVAELLPFVEVQNAFPNIETWFDWTDSNNTPPFNGGVQLAAAVDIDDDGKKELILLMGRTYSNVYQGANPARAKFIILKLNSKDQFEDYTTKFIVGENSIPGLPGHDIVVADLNGDGKKDFIFNFNQDAGGIGATAPYNGFGVLLSDTSGQYKLVLVNQGKGVQDLSVGYDLSGEAFIFPAGSGINVDLYPNPPYKVKNNQLYAAPGIIPNIDPMRAFFTSSGQTRTSDRIFTLNQFRMTDVDGYVKNSNNIWTKVGQISSYQYPKVGSIKWVSRESEPPVNVEIVYNKNTNRFVMAEGGSNDGGPMCNFKLTPTGEPFVLMERPENYVIAFTDGGTVFSYEKNWAQDIGFVGVQIKNNQLSYVDIAFKNTPSMYINANQVQCLDVNNDGYMDVVVNFNLVGGVTNLAPIIYLNNKDSTFTAVNYTSQINIFPKYGNNLSSTFVEDFDGDGKMDIVMFLRNPPPVVNGKSTLDGSFRFFKGAGILK